MKTNHKFAHFGILMTVTACLLAAPSSHAQTFAGQEKLTTTPASFEAIIYPVSTRPATIRVNFNNPTAGGIRVVIRDEKGREIYSEFETVAQYRQRFDLSPMPAGKYTIELKKRDDHFAQTFTIEKPTTSYITMGNQPVMKKIEPPVDKKLIVSQ